MGTRTRYVVVGILMLAILTGVSLSHGLSWGFVQLGWEDVNFFTRELTLSRIVSYGIALAAALFVIKHAPTFQLANEVVDELSKVSWPSRDETSSATVVVIVTVILCSLYLGVFDAVWLFLTNKILGVDPS